MTGRITMLGISRWTEAGGSYRTVQRLFNTEIPWPKLQWFLIRQHLMNQIGVILIVGDECTTPKAGLHTFGLGRFFSSIYNKTIPGLCHLTISLVSVRERIAYPLFTVPVPPTVKKEEAPAAAEPATKRGPGRPKGSRNSSRHDVEFTAFQLLLKTTLLSLLALIGADLPLAYFVYDGALGHNTGVQLVRQCGLHLISKLRHDSALYFPFAGPQSGRGRHKKYGSRINLTGLPKRFLKRTSVKDGIREAIYQITLLHKNFADPLNVVIIIRTNLKTKKSAHAFYSVPTWTWLGISSLSIMHYGSKSSLTFGTPSNTGGSMISCPSRNAQRPMLPIWPFS
jgi:putative transposase